MAVHVTHTDAHKAAIAAAGGVEAIVQGMEAHVGVAGVQEWGAGALWNLAAGNGAFGIADSCRTALAYDM